MISFLCKRLSRVFASTTIINALVLIILMVQISHPQKTTEKLIALTIPTSVGKVTSLLFNILSSLSWLSFHGTSVVVFFNFMAAVSVRNDLESKKRKSVTVSTFSPSIYHAVVGPEAMVLVFES